VKDNRLDLLMRDHLPGLNLTLMGFDFFSILKNFSLNLLSKMFILTEIIDCIFLLFSKILSPVLSISPLY
jgi:hypothetical protein